MGIYIVQEFHLHLFLRGLVSAQPMGDLLPDRGKVPGSGRQQADREVSQRMLVERAHAQLTLAGIRHPCLRIGGIRHLADILHHAAYGIGGHVYQDLLPDRLIRSKQPPGYPLGQDHLTDSRQELLLGKRLPLQKAKAKDLPETVIHVFHPIGLIRTPSLQGERTIRIGDSRNSLHRSKRIEYLPYRLQAQGSPANVSILVRDPQGLHL